MVREHGIGHTQLCCTGVNPPTCFQRHVGKPVVCITTSDDVGLYYSDDFGCLVICWLSTKLEVASRWSASGMLST